MPGRTSLYKMILAGLLTGMLFAAIPARADGFVQSLFNTGNNNSGAKPLFLKGSNASGSATGKVFDLNGDNGTGGGHPSVAGAGQATQARNDVAIRANVARSALAVANEHAQIMAAHKKAETARLAASEEQRRQTSTNQAARVESAKAAANRAAASAPIPRGASAPAAAEDAPLYVTPGQANTGQAPIFGVH